MSETLQELIARLDGLVPSEVFALRETLDRFTVTRAGFETLAELHKAYPALRAAALRCVDHVRLRARL